MIIDSHVHFWKFDKVRDTWINNDMKILQQDYLPEQLLPTLKRNGVDGVIAVQAEQSELETHFLIEMAKTHSFIKGVVGWIDLAKNNIEERLDYFSQYKIVKGWRHIVQGEPAGFLSNTEFQRGVAAIGRRGYTYDLLIYAHQMNDAVGFADAVADQPIILDHCGKPSVRTKEMKEWEAGIRKLAQHPQIYCKLSGLFTEAKWKEWSPSDFYPYLDVVFDAFGAQRVVWGSDWPVILLSGIYVQWKSLVEKYMENFSQDERAEVFGGNASTFYRL